jgi:hypothetical protein
MKLIERLSATPLLFTAFLLIMIGAVSIVSAQDAHGVAPVACGNTPVSPAEMNQRVRSTALKFQQYGKVPRIGLYDMAHPADLPEYIDLAGNAVLLVTVVTQQQSELPLKSVYLEWRGQRIELKLIAAGFSNVTDKEVSQILGAYQLDALYLAPLFLGFDEADLMTDFAANRTGFKLGALSGSLLSAEERAGVKLPPEPNPEVLGRFIQREYPGFAKIIKD